MFVIIKFGSSVGNTRDPGCCLIMARKILWLAEEFRHSEAIIMPRAEAYCCLCVCVIMPRAELRRYTVIVLSVSQSVCLLQAFLVAR